MFATQTFTETTEFEPNRGNLTAQPWLNGLARHQILAFTISINSTPNCQPKWDDSLFISRSWGSLFGDFQLALSCLRILVSPTFAKYVMYIPEDFHLFQPNSRAAPKATRPARTRFRHGWDGLGPDPIAHVAKMGDQDRFCFSREGFCSLS